ncbi:MAG TPA: hypothetical protein VNW99_13395 [Cytophagaceae bacterium]|nr:hypothetical protein [Cytophagaceae bacterium]
MKYIFTLACILSLGAYASIMAQELTDNTVTTSSAQNNNSKADTLPGMGKTSIVNSAEYTKNSGTCTLVQNIGLDRKMTNKKNGYKIVTNNKAEKINVTKGKNGARRIKYYGETETVKYHKDPKGRIHYKYTYYDDCRKILVRKNKKGITTTNHKSSLDPEEIDRKVVAAILMGVNTCSITD